MKPKNTKHRPIVNSPVLISFYGPKYKIRFETKGEHIIIATEYIAKINPTIVLDIPFLSNSKGKNGAINA